MKIIKKEFEDKIAGVDVKVRYYYDDETKEYSFQTNPILRDESYSKFVVIFFSHDNLPGLDLKYELYKMDFTNVVEQRENPNF